MKKALTGLACFLILCLTTTSQSIYSFQGLGSLNHQGMPNNVGMGEVGIGSPTVWHVNTLNPANLVFNTFSTFQVGVELDTRNFSAENGLSGSDTDGGLRFLGYAFPIIPGKWSSSFGVLPLSSVSYNTFSTGNVAGTDDVTQVSDNRGEGGLTNLYWANGFSIKKKLNLGVRATYTFGSIEKESTISIGGADVPVSNISYRDQESYSDINFLFGLGYRYILSEDRYLNFGLTYSPKSQLNGTSELELVRLSNAGGELESQEVSTSDITQKLPQTLGFGLSYQKPSHYTIGFDIEVQQWSNVGSATEPYNNLSKIAFGATWIPDYDNVSSYLKRTKYSIGFNRTRLPYIVNDQALTDFGINFGATLPVSGFSSIDLAFKWGQLGEISNGLIKENYFKIVLGATINDRWFIKRRYD
ncbi:MAG: hypothetical protein AAF391_01785 [Bacteroidota bacterium]